MAKRYWTKAQRASEKRRKTSRAKPKPRSTKPKKLKLKKLTKAEQARQTRAAKAAKKGWETRRKRERVEHARRVRAAKKARETRASKQRALTRVEKAVKREVEKVQEIKAEIRQATKKPRGKRRGKPPQKLKPITKRELKELEAGAEKHLQEGFDRTLLKKFAPEKARKDLTPEEVEDLRRRARPKLRKLFKKVIKEGIRTGEIKKLREPFNEIIATDGFKSTGSKIHLRIMLEMNEAAVEDILYRAGEATKRLYEADPRKLWYAVIAISSLGRKLYVGGAIKFKESKNPLERLVMLESFPSTGLQPSMSAMLVALRAKLENLVDEGTLTLVRYVTVRTFDFKTREQRVVWKQKHGEKNAPEPTTPLEIQSKSKSKKRKRK